MAEIVSFDATIKDLDKTIDRHERFALNLRETLDKDDDQSGIGEVSGILENMANVRSNISS